MEPEGSLPHSNAPATCPYPEPHQSISSTHPTSWWSLLILPSHLRLGLPSGLFHSGFPTETLQTRATCPSHLIFLDLFTWIIFGEEYRSLSFSLCGHHHYPVTSSFLGPNILLSTLFSNTLSLRTSLIVTHQVSHPYRRTGKIYSSVYLNLCISG